MAKSNYNLIWSVDGGEQRHTIENYPLFIGRLPLKFRGAVGDYNPLNVYIYYPSSGKAHFTGIVSATVSRFHVKLEEEGGRVFLIDHGSTGKGSRNGTYLNGERIQPGKRVQLNPGDSFQLGRLGPVFTLTISRVEGETIVLNEGVPRVVPRSLANKLTGVEGIEVEAYDRFSAIVVPQLREGKRIQAKGLVVYVERLSQRERVLKTLFQLQNVIIDALSYLKEKQDLEAAKSILSKIKLRVYRDVIKDLNDDEIQCTYNDLLRVIGMDLIDPNILVRRLEKFKHLIRAYVESS